MGLLNIFSRFWGFLQQEGSIPHVMPKVLQARRAASESAFVLATKKGSY